MNKSTVNFVSNARALGVAIGELKSLESQREAKTEAVNKLITQARGQDKGKAWLAMLGKSAATCAIRASFKDGMIQAGYTEKYARNTFALVKYCVEKGSEFSFSLAKKLAAANKPKAPATTEVQPSDAPTVGGSAQVTTTDNARTISAQPGNNGPEVRTAPDATPHDMAIQYADNARMQINQLFLLLGKVHYKSGQTKCQDMAQELADIIAFLKDATK